MATLYVTKLFLAMMAYYNNISWQCLNTVDTVNMTLIKVQFDEIMHIIGRHQFFLFLHSHLYIVLTTRIWDILPHARGSLSKPSILVPELKTICYTIILHNHFSEPNFLLRHILSTKCLLFLQSTKILRGQKD